VAVLGDDVDFSMSKGGMGKGDDVDCGGMGKGDNCKGDDVDFGGKGKQQPGKLGKNKGKGKSKGAGTPSGWLNKMIVLIIAIEEADNDKILELAAEYSQVPSIVPLLERARAFIDIQADTVHKSTAYCNGGCNVLYHTMQLLDAHMQPTACVV
jgi:hypothetical protein